MAGYGDFQPMSSGREKLRRNARFRVRSRGLPGYQALTIDFSQEGVQLETSGELKVGEQLLLELEFDREDLRNFSCPAKVVWSEPQANLRDNRFRAGLVFAPIVNEQRVVLARTATVLQAHSEADLDTLLEEAKMIDPERAATFARVRSESSEPAPLPTSSKRVLPLLGVYIPLRIILDSYHWDRKSQVLCVSFLDVRQEHRLYFPSCRVLTDYGCAHSPTVSGLFCSPHSEAIKRLASSAPGVHLKHYRFLKADRGPVLELVSAPCVSVLSSGEATP